MKLWFSIGLLFILAIFVPSSAQSQTKSSSTQTVLFSVHHSDSSTGTMVASMLNSSASSNKSVIHPNETVLKTGNAKITITVASSSEYNGKNIPVAHIDIQSVFQTKYSIAIDKTPHIITITD